MWISSPLDNGRQTWVIVHGLARDDHAGPIRQRRGADVDAIGAGVEGAVADSATGAPWQQSQLVSGRTAQGHRSVAVARTKLTE